jgi:hypothetical protein
MPMFDFPQSKQIAISSQLLYIELDSILKSHWISLETLNILIHVADGDIVYH